ncbi:MAG: preprotein translocase subunit SecE [Thermoleophilia bacterium]|nr:preprotein translocase subunit SecE [Thermoleophilia bacterium]
MARNRQRAKQRKARQGPRKPGQGSRPVEARSDVASDAGEAPPQDSGFTNVDAVEVKDELKLEREAKAKKKKPVAAKPAAAKAKPKAAAEPRQRGRLAAFLRSSWAELRRVQWPDRKQITTLTSIVIGFVIVSGVYLGAIDWVANKLVNLII